MEMVTNPAGHSGKFRIISAIVIFRVGAGGVLHCAVQDKSVTLRAGRPLERPIADSASFDRHPTERTRSRGRLQDAIHSQIRFLFCHSKGFRSMPILANRYFTASIMQPDP